jgi:hypothetical protein
VSDRGPFARSILRACRSQKRVSVMACVSAHRVRSRVLVSSTFPSSPTSSCAKATLTTTPCCRRAPAQCPAKESTAFPTPTQPYSTPPHVAATCFTKERSATSTGVEGDCRGPRAFVFTPRRHPRLRSDARRPGWAVCCERRASHQQTHHLDLRQGDKTRSNLSFRRRASPGSVPPRIVRF